MKKEIIVESTSSNSAEVSPIELSEKDYVKITFYPELINNQKVTEESVKGKVVYQKKKKKDDFIPFDKLSKGSMRVGDWMEIALSNSETFNLYKGLEECYSLYGNSGIPYNKSTFVICDEVKCKAETTFGNDITPLLENITTEKSNLLENIITLIANGKINSEIISAIQKLNSEDFSDFSNNINFSRIKKVLEEWDENSNNSDEEFWQKFFRENAWIISQCFGTPTLYFEDKAYVGGKKVNNKGGNLVDFLYINELTNNIAVVEIKTPTTRIIKRGYRATYTFDDEVVGSINQVLNYRKELVQNYKNLRMDDDREYFVVNPKCYVIIGNIDSLSKPEMLAFENFRNELNNVEVVTYDELFKRLTGIMNIFKQER